MTVIRALNTEGVEEFRSRLRERDGSLLSGDARNAILAKSDVVPGAGVAPNVEFQTKLRMAEHLDQALAGVDREFVARSVGLWTWLSVNYFEQLVQPSGSGFRIGHWTRYVLSEDRRREYRHLIKGPYNIFRLHGARARLLLSAPVYRWTDLEEQTAGVIELIRMPGAMEAADILYFDPTSGKAKRGATNRKQPGTIRRFGAVVQQLDLTYDLFSMNGGEIVEMLPREFDRFRK